MVEHGYQLTNVVEALRAEGDVAAGDFANEAWSRARAVELARYWSGAEAPAHRRAAARVLWGDEALTVRFDCRQREPLVASAAPRLDRKTIGLWERDVCEIFLAPDPSAPERYFEFEAAPTGEWLDLFIRLHPQGRETDWHYRSGMTAAARLDGDSLTVGLRVPWRGLGARPRAGERWRANLFRCVGAEPDRGYLAWQPTHTPEPGFHVPEKFGWIRFK
ncbi:MAG TPA: carbohydrate-binding family 9-like protein [Pyrinomonadaceae bacterium]|nr:carbohydrate-binding family 9-like protein [Pyrinomonadaceae bacterium]